ncbi:MAG: hypothetical protein RSE94_02110 [Pseudomonas sp.]
MATRHQYGPFADRKGVTKTAKKLSVEIGCDTFVTATANNKYQCWYAEFPGDRPPAGFTVVDEFRFVPPLPEPEDPLTAALHALRNVPATWPEQFRTQLLDTLELIVSELRNER